MDSGRVDLCLSAMAGNVGGCAFTPEALRTRSAAGDNPPAVGFHSRSGERDVPRAQHRLRLFRQGLYGHRDDRSIAANFVLLVFTGILWSAHR